MPKSGPASDLNCFITLGLGTERSRSALHCREPLRRWLDSLQIHVEFAVIGRAVTQLGSRQIFITTGLARPRLTNERTSARRRATGCPVGCNYGDQLLAA